MFIHYTKSYTLKEYSQLNSSVSCQCLRVKTIAMLKPFHPESNSLSPIYLTVMYIQCTFFKERYTALNHD